MVGSARSRRFIVAPVLGIWVLLVIPNGPMTKQTGFTRTGYFLSIVHDLRCTISGFSAVFFRCEVPLEGVGGEVHFSRMEWRSARGKARVCIYLHLDLQE